MIRAFGLAMVCCMPMLVACNKSDAVALPPVEPPVITGMQFRQDTSPIAFPVTNGRRESIGTLRSTTIYGEYPDTITKPNRITLRIIGDSARTYRSSEIIASYTDSAGTSFSSIAATTDSVSITQLQKSNNGLVKGLFFITVYNTTRTKSLVLRQGSFTTRFTD